MISLLLRRALHSNLIHSCSDFSVSREYLVKHKYVGAGKVAINGGSNGGEDNFSPLTYFSDSVGCVCWSTGLLVAACVNRAPEGTFGAAVAEVGVLDLLRVIIPRLCSKDPVLTLIVFLVCELHNRYSFFGFNPTGNAHLRWLA